MSDSPAIVDLLRRPLAARGLDLLQPFSVDWYNDSVSAEYTLPDFGRGSALGVLIGNTRALWPAFVAALRTDRRRLQDEHPLDRWVIDVVTDALAGVAVRHAVRWAHEPAPRRVAMQRLCHVSGLAALSPSQLCVHAIYGPWIGLRAAVTFDADGPIGSAADPRSPCPDCTHACLPRLDRAMRQSESGDPADLCAWVAVRDACPVGRSHRYSEEQIRYHYVKDRERLRRIVSSGSC